MKYLTDKEIERQFEEKFGIVGHYYGSTVFTKSLVDAKKFLIKRRKADREAIVDELLKFLQDNK